MKPTRVAFYTRYSDDQQDPRTIDAQLANLRAHASKEGWYQVQDYIDEHISGKHTSRDGFQRMLRDAGARRFEILAVDDLTRLSRDDVDLRLCVEDLARARVRVIALADGFDTAREDWELQISAHGLTNVVANKGHRHRTKRSQLAQARKGFWLGSRPYGYTLEPVLHRTEKNQYGKAKQIGTHLEPLPREAKVVRTIFEMFVKGYSERAIADHLNQKHVPSPGSTWKRKTRRARSWMGSAVRVILRNEVYSGLVIYNKHEWKWERHPDNPRKKHRVCHVRPQSEWVVNEKPEWRIVSKALWAAASKIISGRKATVYKAGGPAKYLLSGLLKCACGAHYVSCSKTQMGCGSYLDGGTSACSNSIRINRKAMEAQIMGALKKYLHDPARVKRMVREIQAEYEQRLGAQARQDQAEPARVTELDQRLAQARERLRQGDPLFTPQDIQELIRKLEGERALAQHRTATKGTRTARVEATLIPHAAEKYTRMIERGLEGDPEEMQRARMLLRDLLGGQISLKKTPKGLLLRSTIFHSVLWNGRSSFGSGGRI